MRTIAFVCSRGVCIGLDLDKSFASCRCEDNMVFPVISASERSTYILQYLRLLVNTTHNVVEQIESALNEVIAVDCRMYCVWFDRLRLAWEWHGLVQY